MRSLQHGFTLIELLVAVTIGLVLTIVVATLFLHSRSTYGSTDELSRMQENIRYSHQLLTRMLHQTSYTTAGNAFKDFEDAPAGSAPLVAFDATNPAFAAVDGGGLGADEFTVRFQGSGSALAAADGTITDCHGRDVAAGQTSVNRFYIAVGANGGMALWCDSSFVGAGPNTVARSEEMVADVENMQLVYGEDTVDNRDGSGRRDGTPERYLSVSEIVPAATNMNKIVVVRVALLFRTPNIMANVLPESNRTYDLNGTTLGPFTDRRIRRPVTMTINLRNRYWAVYK
jgi:type IV pilus assembly protein PilW